MWMLKNSGSTLDSRRKAQSLTLMDDRKTSWWMEKRRNDLGHVQPCLPEDTHTKKNHICLPVHAVPSVPCPGGLVILLRGSCTSGLPVSSTTEFQWAVIVAVIFFLPLYMWHVCRHLFCHGLQSYFMCLQRSHWFAWMFLPAHQQQQVLCSAAELLHSFHNRWTQPQPWNRRDALHLFWHGRTECRDTNTDWHTHTQSYVNVVIITQTCLHVKVKFFSYNMKKKNPSQSPLWRRFKITSGRIAVFLYFISIYLLNVQCGHTKSTTVSILRLCVYFFKICNTVMPAVH